MSVVELARRVEALEGPDRTIDCAIFATVRPDVFGDGAAMYARLDWTRNRGDWLWLRDKGMPAYTASLDAAMTLVPDKAWWWVEAQPLVHGKFLAGCGDERVSGGATPALALTAAALHARAMIAKAVEEGGDG